MVKSSRPPAEEHRFWCSGRLPPRGQNQRVVAAYPECSAARYRRHLAQSDAALCAKLPSIGRLSGTVGVHPMRKEDPDPKPKRASGQTPRKRGNLPPEDLSQPTTRVIPLVKRWSGPYRESDPGGESTGSDKAALADESNKKAGSS